MIVETVRAGDAVLCCIVRDAELPATTEFATSHDATLQVGHIVHSRGHEIARHEHQPEIRHVTGTAEVLLVRRGRCEIDVYDAQRRLVTTRELRIGDIVVLLVGGHGIRMLEDTVLLEVKQGPYSGVNEKIPF